MKINLHDSTFVAIMKMTTAAAHLDGKEEVDTIDLAKLKKRCEEFLALPLIQALDSGSVR